MKSVKKIVGSILAFLGVLATFDGSINFLKRLEMTDQQMETISIIIQASFKIAVVISVIIGFHYLQKLQEKYDSRTNDLKIQIEALKKKLFVLKWFRDKESVRMVNHFNANNHTFEKRLDDLNGKVQAYTNDNSIYQHPHYIKVDKESRNKYEREINTYNEAFSEWNELPKYGHGDMTTLYKGKDYKTD